MPTPTPIPSNALQFITHHIALSDLRLPFTKAFSFFFHPRSRSNTSYLATPLSFLSSKHLPAGIFHCLRLAADSNKNLHQRHFISLFASTHARILRGLSMYLFPPGGIYLAQKRRIFVTEDTSRITPELNIKKFAVSKYIIVYRTRRTVHSTN